MDDQLKPTDSPPANRPRDPLADYRLSPEEIAGRREPQPPSVTPAGGLPPNFGQQPMPQHAPSPPTMSTPGVWPPSPDGFAPPTPRDLLGLPPAPYHSPLGMSRVLIGLLAAKIAIAWLTVAVVYSSNLHMEQAQLCDRLSYVLYLATAISFSIYTNRLYKNLAGFNAAGLSTTPTMAPFWFFVPVMSIWMPQRVYQDIWQASDPGVRDYNANAWQASAQSSIITNWWGCFIIGNVLSRLMKSIADALITLDVSTAATTISGVLAILVVNAVALRQEAKQSIVEQYRASIGVPYTPPM